MEEEETKNGINCGDCFFTSAGNLPESVIGILHFVSPTANTSVN